MAYHVAYGGGLVKYVGVVNINKGRCPGCVGAKGALLSKHGD